MEECKDSKCPFHGSLAVRGQTITGVVVRDKMQNSVIVQKEYARYVPKYKRYMKVRSRIPAHNPPCIKAKTGDKVELSECRKLSKTKAFVVTKKL
ncbi:MAG: 30S ribosomal protein S17 [Candidatus Diapherotrites archaeon]|nr:30S ribosomal protein S17 [Candidatus Diapherotrites archaeon]